MRRMITAMSAAAAMVAAAAMPALADGHGAPVVREVHEGSGSRVAFHESEVCGFEIHEEWTHRGNIAFYEDGTLIDHTVFDSVLTTPDGGGPVYFSQHGRFEFRGDTETFDPATGLLTIEFGGMVTGAPATYRVPGEGVLTRDAGRDKFDVTIVIDPETGELVSEDFSGQVSGPHPTWDGIDVVCRALAS